jgi:sarcosine oxidase
MLFPERIIKTQLAFAKRNGAQLHFDSPVLAWQQEGQHVRLVLSDHSFICKRVVFCAGSQVQRFLPPVCTNDFKVCRQVLVWFSAPEHSPFRKDSMPPFIRLADKMISSDPTTNFFGEFYGFPALSIRDHADANIIGGIKIGIEQIDEQSNPNVALRPSTDEESRELLIKMRNYLDWDFSVHEKMLGHAACHYTMTPDSHFRMGFVPGTQDTVYIASACSGHGFKHSAALGEAIAQQLLADEPSLSLDPFSLDISESLAVQ